MSPLRLPGARDRIILITPPTTFVATDLFLYGHRLYTIPFHTERLFGWLRERCGAVTHLNLPLDPESRPRPIGTRVAGPRSRQPLEVDCHAFGLDDATLRRRLTQGDAPSQVWITTMFAYDRDLLSQTILAVKDALPEVPVVLGGAYASLCPDDCLAMGADRVHTGLLQAAEDREETRIGPFGFVVAGRGCPNRCSYCAFSRVEGERATSRDPAAVLAQAARLAEGKAEALALYSPAIFRGPLAAPSEAIVEGLAGLGLGVLGWAGFEPRVVTPRRARMLRAAGFVDPTVPLQTYDRALARGWGRRETLEDFERAIEALLEAGYSRLEIGADVIIGHPDQPLEETARAMCYLWTLGITPVVFPYTWIPGSADAARLPVELGAARAESFHPYLFPFARAPHAACDYMELVRLSRVLPPLVDAALSHLDPGGPVVAMLRRHLDSFGFSVPQWPLREVPAPRRAGYSTAMSHPWELATAMLEGGARELPEWLARSCREVRTCEPRYAPVAALLEAAKSR